MPIYVNPGVTSNNLVVKNQGLYISSGGTVNNTTLQSGGIMYCSGYAYTTIVSTWRRFAAM